jgi:3-phosphoshikimate 1-carboxyvinyltransferase
METIRVARRTRPLDATVEVPGSKSVANRALICAALADGDSELRNVPDGDDTEAMIDCLEALGVGVGRHADGVVVHGVAGVLQPTGAALRCRLAGTTSRFVTALAALAASPITIDGEPPLRSRPMGPLHVALTQLGVSVEVGDGGGGLPACVRGPAKGSMVSLPGDVSSQYISALMLIGPYLPDGLTIRLTSAVVSRPYLLITSAVMAAFGHRTVVMADDEVRIGPGRYTAIDYAVEPDASSASYPLAAAAMVGGRVRVPGLGSASLQGDRAFAQLLDAMGCHVEQDHHSTTVRGAGVLHGIEPNMVDISDLVPTFAVAAAVADSPSRVTGVGFIRRKESDRLGDLCAELRKTGADAAETADGLIIRPAELRGASLATHHDHRLAMAFGLLGLVVDGIEVAEPGVVTKSWPGYWTMLDSLV